MVALLFLSFHCLCQLSDVLAKSSAILLKIHQKALGGIFTSLILVKHTVIHMHMLYEEEILISLYIIQFLFIMYLFYL